MEFRKLKGSFLFDGKELLPGKTLIVDNEGAVADIIPFDEQDGNVEKLDGILAPAFINCHCHLELSHLQGYIPEHTGLVDFLLTVVGNRNQIFFDKNKSIREAEEEMFREGIAGVADICNTTDGIEVKTRSRLRWHNLIEVINFYDRSFSQQWSIYENVWQAHHAAGLDAVYTPHAPYSISAATYQAINEATRGDIISMHNQETIAENELFETGGGDFLRLFANFSQPVSPFPTTGKTSLQTWLPQFTNGQTILIVHNTFTSEADIQFATEHATKYGLNLFYCLCPNANLYIENKLPPVDLLVKTKAQIVLGTDSYSSNKSLSIASEMKTLKDNFPQLSMETLLQWATSNGAAALRWSDLGHFKKGTKPGVVLLSDDFSVQRLIG